MNPDRAEASEEQLARLLAAYDEADAAGKHTDTPIAPDTPADVRNQFEQEVAWCRLIRRLLPRADSDSSSSSNTPPQPVAFVPPIPKRLGRFDVHRELGRGGFGVVFLAFDPRLGREVALKVPHPHALTNPELRARFQHEARATASLDHPNLVPVYETGEDGAVCYIASAYCPGISLSSWLRTRDEPVPFGLAARLVATLAEAVEHAHSRGILHRDLKPGNIMLSPRQGVGEAVLTHPPSHGSGDGEMDFIPRVLDFGLAKILEDADVAVTRADLTQSGAILGTPAYAAPEQAGGQIWAIGPATDVHALGTILYELLTGRPPFRGESAVETLIQVRTQEPLAPGRLRSKLPRDLETICLKCLQKDPRKRYPSAQALADDLHRYLTLRPILARRTGTLGRGMLWCRRNPALAATVTLAVLAVSVVAGAGLHQVFQERERYRVERDRAQGNLYRALVGEARTLMQARDTGWWWKAMDNIRQASTLEVPDRDPSELRELAIQCMGTEHSCMRLQGTWEGHTGPITSTAFSPDGRMVASGSRDQTVRLWSVPDGQPLAVLSGHTRMVNSVAFHATGKWLASSSADGSVRLWDVSSLPVPEQQEKNGEVSKFLAAVDVFELKAGAVNALEWSPDGASLVAACQDGTIHVLAMEKNATRARPGTRIVSGHSGPVTCLAFSETGVLASASQDRTIRFWDLAVGEETDVWTTDQVPNTLLFSGSGCWWGEPENYGLALRHPKNNRSVGLSLIPPSPIRQVRLARKSRLLTASADGTVKLCVRRVLGGTDRLQEEAVARGTWGEAHTVAIDVGGQWVAVGYADGRVRLWELAEPPQRTWVPTLAFQSATFVGGERVLADTQWLHDFSRGWNGPARSFSTDSICALAVHPAGRWFAIGDDKGTLVIGNLQRPGESLACSGHQQMISGLATSPDGRRLASASTDGLVKFWSWETGASQSTLDPGLGPLHGLAWSDDNRALAIAGERGVVVCDLDNQPKVRTISQHALRTSNVATSGDFLAFSGPEGTVEIRELHTGRKLHTLQGHKNLVSALAFSANGKLLASGAANETIRLWDVEEKFAEREAIDLQARGSTGVNSLAFDPQGRYLVGSFSRPTLIWDVRSRPATPIAQVDGDCGRFTAQGTSLLTRRTSSVLEWTIADVEKARAQAQGKTKVAPSTFVQVLLPSTTPVQGGHSHAVWGVAASPDGRWIATSSADRTVKLWDVNTRKLIHTLEGHRDVVWCVAFSPDSKRLASGSEEPGSGSIKVWDVETGREIHSYQGHKRLVFGLAFHPTKPWLVSSSLDGSVCLWDHAAGKSLGVLHQFDRAVYSVAFHPDGHWLAASCLDHRIAVWELPDATTGPRPPTQLLEGHGASVYSVGFSADGRYLASGSEQGEMILWDGRTFAHVTTLRTGTGQIRSISFSRDGQLLAGAAYGGSPIIVWDLGLVRSTLAEMNLDW